MYALFRPQLEEDMTIGYALQCYRETFNAMNETTQGMRMRTYNYSKIMLLRLQ